MAPAATTAAEDLSWRRLETLVDVAAAHRTSVPLGEVVDLLPDGAPSTPGGVASLIRGRPGRLAIVDGRVSAPAARLPAGLAERIVRGQEYLATASQLLDGPLARTRGWVECAGVTGSTAYGAPEAGDDLDFLVVARRGAVWVFLLYSFLALRRARASGRLRVPIEACFNYVLDSEQAERDFATPRGLLVAREAMTARPLWGAERYRGLIVGSPWLEAQLPRLYERWRAGGPSAGSSPPAPLGLRLLNALVFPPLALYLHARGALLNRRFRDEGHADRRFVTETGLRRLALRSERFDRLSARYAPGSEAVSRP